MTAPIAATFASRACPYCGSNSKSTLLRLTPEVIFRSNWSYRREARQYLTLDPLDSFPIEECATCGFAYAGLLPDPQFLKTVYDRVIDADAARRSNLSPASLAAKMDCLSTLLRFLAQESPLRILDFGCGFGPALQLLNSVPSINAVGYETSESRLRELRARGLNVTGDLVEIQRRAPFAAIILDNVLEHVPNPRETVAFISRVCEPGGVLFVSVPDAGRERILAQRQAGSAVAMDINPWEHLNYFDLAHLDALLSDFNLRPLESAALPGPVDIGLRPLASRTGRFRNGLASLPRLFAYLTRGNANLTVTRRFYRQGPEAAMKDQR